MVQAEAEVEARVGVDVEFGVVVVVVALGVAVAVAVALVLFQVVELEKPLVVYFQKEYFIQCWLVFRRDYWER